MAAKADSLVRHWAVTHVVGLVFGWLAARPVLTLARRGVRCERGDRGFVSGEDVNEVQRPAIGGSAWSWLGLTRQQ